MAVFPAGQDWLNRLTEEARILGEARMLRDDQEITPDIAEQIVKKLREHLERVKKSEAWAAKSMAISATTLSEVLGGTYAAKSEKHYRAIDKWIELQILKENAPRPSGFVKSIDVSMQIYRAARLAMETSSIVMVHGPAGIGKTITAQAIRAETPGSIFISITTAGQRKLAVLSLISTALRLPAMKFTSHDLFQQIVDTLKGTGRLLFVDEVHKLEGRQKDEALHCLRDLHDATEIPMLWLGMSSIAKYIQTGQAKGYESLDQLHSRIGFWLNLTEAANADGPGGGLYSIEDIRSIITAGKLRITPDGARYLQMLANIPGQGALRSVDKLLKLAAKHSEKNNSVIDANILRSIQASRLGIAVAEGVERQMEMRLAASA